MGPTQRQWLQNGLQNSKAPLKLVVSGSVLFANPFQDDPTRPCSGDDFEVFRIFVFEKQPFFSAILWLIRISRIFLALPLKGIQNSSREFLPFIVFSCVILLTGDFHVSDLRMLQAGDEEVYQKLYPVQEFSKPIYQVHLCFLKIASSSLVYVKRIDKINGLYCSR